MQRSINPSVVRHSLRFLDGPVWSVALSFRDSFRDLDLNPSGHPRTKGLVPLGWPLKVAYSKVPLVLLSDASFLR